MDPLKAFDSLFDSRFYPCMQPLARGTKADDVEYFVVIDGVRYVFNRSDKFTGGVRYGMPRWANGALTTVLNLNRRFKPNVAFAILYQHTAVLNIPQSPKLPELVLCFAYAPNANTKSARLYGYSDKHKHKSQTMNRTFDEAAATNKDIFTQRCLTAFTAAIDRMVGEGCTFIVACGLGLGIYSENTAWESERAEVLRNLKSQYKSIAKIKAIENNVAIFMDDDVFHRDYTQELKSYGSNFLSIPADNRYNKLIPILKEKRTEKCGIMIAGNIGRPGGACNFNGRFRPKEDAKTQEESTLSWIHKNLTSGGAAAATSTAPAVVPEALDIYYNLLRVFGPHQNYRTVPREGWEEYQKVIQRDWEGVGSFFRNPPQ